jgi:malonyl-CoA O-methyltransferase
MLSLDRVVRFLRWDAPRRLATQDGYALWADSYPPRPHNALMEAEQSAIAPMIQATAPTRALDVGTGTGRYLPLLASAGAQIVVGLDLSMAMLARQTDGRPRICADACRLPFAEGAFDLVCSSLMVGDVEDLGVWLREMSRVLAPGGHLIYSDFHPTWQQAGWRRTFRAADGRQYEIALFAHAMEDHLAHLRGAGLAVRSIREPRLGTRNEPIVVAFHASKLGRPSGQGVQC